MKVLIVEKSSEILRSMVEMVVAAGHDAVTAVTGKAALSIFENVKPDFVMIGTGIADMEPAGVIASFHLLAEGDWVPVLLLYSPSDDQNDGAWFKCGADLVLALPPDRLQIHAHLALAKQITSLRERTQSLVVEMEDLRSELRSMSLRDVLTGLSNRRHFDEVLGREWNRAFRSGDSLSLLLIDIDEFHAYNEKNSTAAGDACLRRIATVLAGAARRAGDLLARCGGDEFALILPTTDEDGAKLIARRLSDAVDALGIPAGSSEATTSLSVSIGVVYEKPGPQTNLDHFVRCAQEAMSRAKQSGRKAIVTHKCPDNT